MIDNAYSVMKLVEGNVKYLLNIFSIGDKYKGEKYKGKLDLLMPTDLET